MVSEALKLREENLTALSNIATALDEGDHDMQMDDDARLYLHAVARGMNAAIGYSVAVTHENSTRAYVCLNSDNYFPDNDEWLKEGLDGAVDGLLVFDTKNPAVIAEKYLPLKAILYTYAIEEDTDVEKIIGIYKPDLSIFEHPTARDFQKISQKIKSAVMVDQLRGNTTELAYVEKLFLSGKILIKWDELYPMPDIKPFLENKSSDEKPEPNASG
jgi:hypothetical protein